jgi:hypothetical protein
MMQIRYEQYQSPLLPPIQNTPVSGMVSGMITLQGHHATIRIKEKRNVLAEEMLILDCPYCGAAIYQPLSWFKKTYSTCPACDQGLAASQFENTIFELEQALDESIDEMVYGKPHSGCCGNHDHS